jgi:PAS domain S-box-containing protein
LSPDDRYRDLFQRSLAGIYRTTPAGRILDCNPAFAAFLGYLPEELLQTQAQALYFDVETRDANLGLLRAEGQVHSGEVRMRRKDGVPVWALFSEALRRTASGEEVIEGTLIDVTDRREAQAALLEGQHRVDQALRAARAGAWERRMQAGKETWSDTNFELLGYRPGSVEAGFEAWRARLHPDDAAATERAARHGDLDIQYRVVWDDGSVHWIRDVGRTVLDETGSPIGMYGIKFDVSERVRAEEELRRTQKLESIGVLAGGLAHDFNNLLTSILASVSLARDAPEDERRELLGDAERASVRARDLTRQLLTFSAGGAPLRRPLSLPKVLRETLGFALAGSPVRGEAALAPDLWPVEADEGQLVQVLNNLLVNAAQAMPAGGRIVLRAWNEQAIEGTGEGPRVAISVEDQGVGIPAAHLSRIFDPYFTTKQKGTGLGLAVVHSIARGHGGRVLVASELGRGSTFTLELPATPGVAVAIPGAPREAPRGRGRILVMDDDDMVARTAERALRRLGYEAVVTRDGAEAVERFQRERDAGRGFDAVILDLTVPGGVGGAEALPGLLALDPAVKAIVSSGYASGSILADFRAHGFVEALAKPWQPEDLAEVLQRVLGSPGSGPP